MNNRATNRLTRRAVLKGSSIAAGGFLTATVVGCGDDDDDSSQAGQPGSSPSPTAQSSIRPGGSVSAVVPEPADLNPHTGIGGNEHQSLWMMHDNLIAYDDKSVPQGDLSLAETWEIVSPTEVILHLRDGVKFHDGTELTSEVVRYNLELVLDPATAAVSRGQIAPIQKIDTPDAKAVRLTLSKPSASLILALGDRGGMVVSRAALEAKGLKGYAATPNGGSGAFTFDNWVRNSNLKLKKNPNYWRMRQGVKLPHLDDLEMKFIAEAAVSTAALQSKQVHLSPISEEDLKVIEKSKDLTVNQFDGTSTSQIFLNRTRPLFKDPRARQAFSYAVDREALVTAITDGRSQPALGPLTPAQWAYDASLPAPSYDPKKAKQLFGEAGITQGTTLKAITYAGREPEKRQVELVQGWLKELGIELQTEFLQSGAAFEQYKKGEHDAFFSGFSIRADPHGSLGEQFLSKGGFAWTQNPGALELEPEVDKLLLQANEEYDLEKRKALYSSAQKLIVSDKAMTIFLYYNNLYLGQDSSTSSTGPMFGGEGKPRFAEVYLKG
jgi:peptide/nickel transport system substrate-binding protein